MSCDADDKNHLGRIVARLKNQNELIRVSLEQSMREITENLLNFNLSLNEINNEDKATSSPYQKKPVSSTNSSVLNQLAYKYTQFDETIAERVLKKPNEALLAELPSIDLHCYEEMKSHTSSSVDDSENNHTDYSSNSDSFNSNKNRSIKLKNQVKKDTLAILEKKIYETLIEKKCKLILMSAIGYDIDMFKNNTMSRHRCLLLSLSFKDNQIIKSIKILIFNFFTTFNNQLTSFIIKNSDIQLLELIKTHTHNFNDKHHNIFILEDYNKMKFYISCKCKNECNNYLFIVSNPIDALFVIQKYPYT